MMWTEMWGMPSWLDITLAAITGLAILACMVLAGRDIMRKYHRDRARDPDNPPPAPLGAEIFFGPLVALSLGVLWPVLWTALAVILIWAAITNGGRWLLSIGLHPNKEQPDEGS